jgi:hypothetical protein
LRNQASRASGYNAIGSLRKQGAEAERSRPSAPPWTRSRHWAPSGSRSTRKAPVDAAEAIGGLTGEVFTAQIFVAVLGTRIYTYAEATFTQSLPDIVGGSIRLGFGNGRRAKRGRLRKAIPPQVSLQGEGA